MSHQENDKERFHKLKTKEEILDEALVFLDDARFAFACFVDCFKRWVEKHEGFKEYVKEKKYEKQRI
jgi:hypothetical protein